MRDRLIELINEIQQIGVIYIPSQMDDRGGIKKEISNAKLADHLIAEGVIVLPCKVGQTVYWLDDGKIKQGEVFEISLHSDGLSLKEAQDDKQ